jgi:hypothetical protein
MVILGILEGPKLFHCDGERATVDGLGIELAENGKRKHWTSLGHNHMLKKEKDAAAINASARL